MRSQKVKKKCEKVKLNIEYHVKRVSWSNKLLFVGGRGPYSQIHLVGPTRQLGLLKQHTPCGVRSTNSLFVKSTMLNVKITNHTIVHSTLQSITLHKYIVETTQYL